jgi:hypothetical protein
MPASLFDQGNAKDAESTEVRFASDARTCFNGAKVYKIPQIIRQRSTFFGSKLKKNTERIS